MSNNSKISEKNALIDDLAKHFENEHQFPPLAGKIYANLILSDKESFTFDDLVCLTSSSKSSVSTQLNFLLDKGKVEFETKENSRKRHFKTSIKYLKSTLEMHKSCFEKEIEILKRIVEFRKNENKNHPLEEIFINHFQCARKNIDITIGKISEHTNN